MVMLAVTSQAQTAQTVTYKIKDVGQVSIPPGLDIRSGVFFGYDSSKVLSDNFSFGVEEGNDKKPLAWITFTTKTGKKGEYPILTTKLSASPADLKYIDDHLKQLTTAKVGKGLKNWLGVREVKIQGNYAIEASYTEDKMGKTINNTVVVFQNNDRLHTLTLSHEAVGREFWSPRLKSVKDSFKITNIR